ncbi:P-loop containing nucleoside triphosphate hydrolase protein [Mrakia frigida]|uniref:P-loop containing nucleoside triphosphate hydrolase protein n=1 Tax=Mrakia frigida TaxID=29902 RepID=UPI003FCBF84B
MSGNLNPGAGAFNFNPNSGGFVPRAQQQQQPQNGAQNPNLPPQGQGYGQQQQPYYPQQGQQGQGGERGLYNPYGAQQGGGGGQGYPQQQQQQYGGGQGQQYNNQQYGGYQQSYNQYNPPQGGGFQAPQARYTPSSSSYAPPSSGPSQAEQLASLPPKVISLGGPKPAPSTTPFVRVEATGPPKPAPSFSLGGPKPAAPKASIGISLAKPKVASTPSILSSSEKASSSPSPSPAPPSMIAAPKAAAPPPATDDSAPGSGASTPSVAPKVGTGTGNYTRAAAKIDANGVLAEVEKHLTDDKLKDLYGGKEIDQNVKQHLNVVFIGHVDAGKSTMGGQLLFLTGMVDKRTLEKFEKEAKEAGRESWYLSWALDSTPQERAKGKTVEVGRAYFETDTRRYTILDAPGHKAYVANMIGGAAQADVALLVISARKGEFEAGFDKGGQTREHSTLVKTAGITKLVVVVNKMDDPTVEWSEERFEFIKSQLSAYLKKGLFNLKDVTFIPVSAYTGANIKEKVTKEVCPWNKSPTLLEFLDGMAAPDRKVNAPFMLPISEKYNDLGTIVVGKIESGRVYRGDTLLLMPNRVPVEVVALYDEVLEELEAAYSGDNIRIRLKGVNDDEVSPGYVLSSAQAPVKTTTQFQAQLAILDSKNIITAGYSAVMHIHTDAEEVRIISLLHYLEAKTGRKSKKPPQFAKTGQQIIALLETDQMVCVEKFSDYPQLGRFTLRDEGKTIAIGKITKLVTAKQAAATGAGEDAPDLASLSVADAAADDA